MFEVKARALTPAGQPVVPVVGVAAVQGAAFAHAVFSAQAEGAVVVVLRSKGDTERVAATGASRIVVPEVTWGWTTPQTVLIQDPEAPAQIVYSSGTTGTPKGIVLTHGNLAASTDRLIEAMAMDHDIREYIGVPVQYSFGLGRARAIARVGGSYFVPEHGFDPSEIAMMLRDGSINAISAVPTLWRVLLANRDVIGDAGSKVRWIEIGSQAMSVAEKTAMKTLFPEAKIVQHYGLTEASRTTFLHIDSATEAQLASVGQPMPGVEVSIDGESRIRIRGPHVASGYLRDGKFDPLADADGWFVTDDIGRIEQGWLYFDNRADDQINSGGIKLHPDAIEAGIAEALPGGAAAHIAVARADDPMRGDAIVVAYETGFGLTQDAVRRAANTVVEGYGLHAGGALHILPVDELPRTETGKVLRRNIGTMIQPDAGSDRSLLEERLVNVWRRVLGVARVGKDDNFFDLGGDPLIGHALIDEMVALGISRPAAASALDGMSIAEIIAADTGATGPEGDARSQSEARLLALWTEALGRGDIDPHKSFYDVGGDSLSAIGLALNMERAGFDGETARAIFDGATISDIAEMMVATQSGSIDEKSAAPRPRVRTQVALLNEGLNLVKGLLIICMICSHWLPLYLDYFQLRDSIGHKLLQPLLSMGSPTLSFCFGIGAAVFYARQYEGSGPAFRSSVRSGVRLLSVGLLLGFVLELGTPLLNGEVLDLGRLAAAFVDGPFLYFTLATASLPLWVPRLMRNWASVQSTFGAAILCYALYEFLRMVLPPAGENQIVESINFVLIGHWSLLQMGAITLAGAATGLIIELLLMRKKLSIMAPYALLLMAAGVVMAVAANDFLSWFQPHFEIIPWAAASYAGLTLYVIARTEAWNNSAEHRPALRLILQTMASIGILLFPLFVMQSVVFHGAAILSLALHLPFLRTLTLLIVLVLIAAAYAVWRVHSLYYGRSR